MKKEFCRRIFVHQTSLSVKHLLFFFVGLLICRPLFSQDGTLAPKYSNEFLSIGVGADALGQGNAFVAQTSGSWKAYFRYSWRSVK